MDTKINQDTRYIMGIKFENVNSNDKVREKFFKVLEEKQQDNIALGYGDESEEWKTKEYNITLDMLKKYLMLTHCVRNSNIHFVCSLTAHVVSYQLLRKIHQLLRKCI